MSPCTGWPFRLLLGFCYHQNRGCLLVYGPYTKAQPLFWCQQHQGNNLNGHPVFDLAMPKCRGSFTDNCFSVKIECTLCLLSVSCTIAMCLVCLEHRFLTKLELKRTVWLRAVSIDQNMRVIQRRMRFRRVIFRGEQQTVSSLGINSMAQYNFQLAFQLSFLIEFWDLT